MALLVTEPAAVRPDAGVVRVTGEERLAFLHTLLSQELEGAEPGTVTDFLFLDAKGNARAEGTAVVRAEDVLLVVAPEVAAELAAAFESSKFLMRVQATDDSSGWALAAIRGTSDGTDVPQRPGTAQPSGEGLVLRVREGFDLLGPPSWVDERIAASGLPQATQADWTAWRIVAGRPAWGAEITAGRRPQELGLLPTHVHLRKGCYPGQESIAKTYNLGRPRKALATVHFDVPVSPGNQVAVGDRHGTVTSSAALDGQWVGLVILPLDAEGKLPDRTDDPPGKVRTRVGEGLPQPGA